LTQIPYQELPRPQIELPKRQGADGYREPVRALKLVKEVY
jgi:hypothetical protein